MRGDTGLRDNLLPVIFDDMDQERLSGKSVVVFGGTGALGSALVERLIAEGAEVAVADVEVPELGNRLDGASYRAVNALDEGSLGGLFAHVAAPVWAVVNVIGGYTPSQALVELDVEILRAQLDLNLITAANITKHAIEAMSDVEGAAPPAAGTASPANTSRGGRIVHTSSRVARGDGKDSFAYSVSKLGVIRLVEAAAAETLDHGITVNCILPSVIDTPANRAAMPSSDHSRWPKPAQIAAVVAWLVSEDAELVSGAAIPVYGRA
jgi:NAD(P)-dependent dehydrogenase (short-subunit alcohol dehydrogenase family)